MYKMKKVNKRLKLLKPNIARTRKGNAVLLICPTAFLKTVKSSALKEALTGMA